MPTSTPIPSKPGAAEDPTLEPEQEAGPQNRDSEPDLPGEYEETPESLYAIRRRRPPRWIPDGSGS